jgi:hypothetical protein
VLHPDKKSTFQHRPAEFPKLGIVVSAFAGIAAGLMAQRIMTEKKGRSLGV